MSKPPGRLLYINRVGEHAQASEFRFDPDGNVYSNDRGQLLKVTDVIKPMKLDEATQLVQDGSAPFGLMELGGKQNQVSVEFVQTPLGGLESAQLTQLKKVSSTPSGVMEIQNIYDVNTRQELDIYFRTLTPLTAVDCLDQQEYDLVQLDSHGDAPVDPKFTTEIISRYEAVIGRDIKRHLPKDHVLADAPDHLVHIMNKASTPLTSPRPYPDEDPNEPLIGLRALSGYLDSRFSKSDNPVTKHDERQVQEAVQEQLTNDRVLEYDSVRSQYDLQELARYSGIVAQWSRQAWKKTRQITEKHHLSDEAVTAFVEMRPYFQRHVFFEELDDVLDHSSKSTDITPTKRDIEGVYQSYDILSSLDDQAPKGPQTEWDAKMIAQNDNLIPAINYRSMLVKAAILYPGQIPDCDDEPKLVKNTLLEMAYLERNFGLKGQGRNYALLSQNPQATMELIKAWM